MTKDEYITFLEEKYSKLYKEVQQLSYENGFLQGQLMIFIQRNPRLGMDIKRGGKYKELQQKGGVQ